MKKISVIEINPITLIIIRLDLQNMGEQKKLAKQLERYLKKSKTEMPTNKTTVQAILYPDDPIRL